MSGPSIRLERYNDPEEALRIAFEGMQAGLWTSLPCIVVSFDPVKLTAVLQPTTQARVRLITGELTNVTITVLPDCPVVFPSGGGLMLTFPLAAGDEVLAVIAARCIDAWWQSGGVQPQAELRLHDLSDGFALPGPRSLPRVPGAPVSLDGAQLRTDDGEVFIQVSEDGVVITAPEVTVDAPEVTFTGDVVVEGNIEVTELTAEEITATEVTAATGNFGDINVGALAFDSTPEKDAFADYIGIVQEIFIEEEPVIDYAAVNFDEDGSLISVHVPGTGWVPYPAAGGSGVESRYEIYSGESVTITAGRIMFQFGGLLNGGGILNGGRVIEAKQV